MITMNHHRSALDFLDWLRSDDFAAFMKPELVPVQEFAPALEVSSSAPPYPWCHQPDICKAKGYCTEDPSCGN